MAIDPLYTFADLLKYGTYSNASLWPAQEVPTVAEILETMKQVKATMAMPANCTTCGTWGGCVCVRPLATMTVHCYVCDAQHDPRVKPPRVCDECMRRYL